MLVMVNTNGMLVGLGIYTKYTFDEVNSKWFMKKLVKCAILTPYCYNNPSPLVPSLSKGAECFLGRLWIWRFVHYLSLSVSSHYHR